MLSFVSAIFEACVCGLAPSMRGAEMSSCLYSSPLPATQVPYDKKPAQVSRSDSKKLTFFLHFLCVEDN
jgi:hypothetical protein